VSEALILELSPEGRILRVNRKSHDLPGLAPSEAEGKNWFDTFLPERVRAQVREVFAKIISGSVELPECFENAVVSAGGRERFIYWHNTPIYGADGKLEKVLSSGIDITELKNTENELKSAMSNPERSNMELEQFAFVASHDLQEPLRAITGYLQLLEKKYPAATDEEAKRYMAAVMSSAERMRQLINDLLALSRVENSRQERVKVREFLSSYEGK